MVRLGSIIIILLLVIWFWFILSATGVFTKIGNIILRRKIDFEKKSAEEFKHE